jgi:1-acyl-sn-glycerol-3-phosphate acyltransferase
MNRPIFDVRRIFNFLILLLIWVGTRLFYRFDFRWIEPVPEEPWGPYKVLTMLNHTSLFEWLYAGGVPLSFLWRISGHAMVPIADKTVNRPIVGRFFKLLAPHMLPITRQADRTWKAVLERVNEDVMIIILPEGRMKRANGLDSEGRPMTVRGGIADILAAIPEGKMLIAYSGGLHHVQVPGQHLPKPFKTLRMNLEEVDIPTYRAGLDFHDDPQDFKDRVKLDLADRRDRHCPVVEADSSG